MVPTHRAAAQLPIKHCFSPSVSLSLSSDAGDNGWHCVTRRWLSVRASQRAINHFGETALWLLMNFSHATTDAGYSITAKRFFLQAEIWRHLSGANLKLCSFGRRGAELFLGRGWDLKLSRSRWPLFLQNYCERCFNIASLCVHTPSPRPLRLFSCVSSWVCLVRVNEREELQLSCSVFLGLCACGLCGLSHSEEPWGDIFGHRLS